MRFDIVILGCGWTGLLLAYELKLKYTNSSIAIVEAANQEKLGGLLRSEIINGFIFDTGGSHIIFSRDLKTLKAILSILKGGWVKHHRKSYIYFDGIFVPYPFENGLYVLPPERRAKFGIGIIEAFLSHLDNPAWRPKNFKEWIYSSFGKELARAYLEPYNEKIWKRSLSQIDVDWVYMPGRIPIPNWKDVVRSIAGIPTIGYKEQLIFYYPEKGGIQTLYNALLEKVIKKGVKILTGERVIKIKKYGDNFVINGKIEARNIYSTIPLHELIKALNAPEYVIKISRELDYNRVIVIGIALDKRAPAQHWIYVPNKSIIFHRYAWISNYSRENAPQGKSALIAEITMPPHKPIDREKLIEDTINGLKFLRIINKENEILFVKVWVNEYGYPIYVIGHKKRREIIQSYLKEQGIHSIGRWGSWHYWSMDKIFIEVKKLISCL